MPSNRPIRPRLLVTIVSTNPSTLEGLDTYLRGVGIATASTGAIERVIEMTPPGATAVIVFPDEYPADVTLDALRTLKRLRPGVLAVIVTSEPHRFGPSNTEGPATSPLVMPKPAWAWTIMDAVRARLDAALPESPIETRPNARREGPHE